MKNKLTPKVAKTIEDLLNCPEGREAREKWDNRYKVPNRFPDNPEKPLELLEKLFSFAVNQWHQSNSNVEVYEYLELTQEEYAYLVEQGWK